jgi:hypothetical protein
MEAALETFSVHRAAFLDGQAQVEGLANFVKERIAMEESYSRHLVKLSKQTLSADGEHERRRRSTNCDTLPSPRQFDDTDTCPAPLLPAPQRK